MFFSKIINYIKTILLFICFTVTPNIFLLNIKCKIKKFKDFVNGYIIGSITIIVPIILCIGTFGIPLANILRYPEYMILKKITIFSFSNLENILTSSYIFDSIIAGFIVLYTLNSILKKYFNNKYALIIITIIVLILNHILFSKNIINIILLYDLSFYIGVILLLLILLCIKYIKKKE